MDTNTLEKASHISKIISAIATVIAAVIAAVAIILGYEQFSKGHELEKKSKAVDYFIKYNEIMKDTPANNFWSYNVSMSIAESIYKLRRDDSGWVETVEWMLIQHKDSLKTAGLGCRTFDDDLEELAKTVAGKDVCTDN
jgi:hypothetical protein